MNAFKLGIGGFAASLLCAGCHTFTPTPEFRNVSLNPTPLRPGDVAVITVEVQDKNDIVDRVEGVLKETPQVTFRLRDDGQAPDEKADDDVWTLRVDVPFDAPPGKFMLEFSAYSSDGEVVQVRDDSGDTVPLATSYPFSVEYAQEAQQ